jgi:hypothetical protein
MPLTTVLPIAVLHITRGGLPVGVGSRVGWTTHPARVTALAHRTAGRRAVPPGLLDAGSRLVAATGTLR